MLYDTIIIGAGPAGITAAIQLTRMGKTILLIERGNVGGLLHNAWRVENYLGMLGGLPGTELARRFAAELDRFAIRVLHENATSVEREHTGFLVRTACGTHSTRTVIIATGTTPRRADIDGEDALAGTCIFYNVCDMPLAEKKKRIAILGGGDGAFDGALSLYDRGHSPFLLLRHHPTCLPPLLHEVGKRNIPMHCEETVQRLTHEEPTVHIHCNSGSFDADLVLVAAGRTPSIPLLPQGTQMGVFFAGDVQNGFCRQVHIATGDGMKAAMEAYHFLSPR